MSPGTHGYSGTPLPRKLGLAAGMRACVVGVPDHYWDLLGPLEADIEFVDWAPSGGEPYDFVHVFTREAAGLSARLREMEGRIAPAGMIWVSWPKRASRVPTDVTEDVVRGAALEGKLVDVKVAAIDETWSGLKLVIRRHLRDGAGQG